VNNLDQLWEFLKARGDAIRDLPEGRWLYDLYDPRRRAGRTYVRRAGYLDGLDFIDTSFIGCSPREAEQIDPQQRLLLETAFEALENAGVPLERIAKSRTGVFVGVSSSDHGEMNNEDPKRINAFSNTGGALSIAANRISYVFDLRGPSMAVDTACSSGLTALDLAVRSIRQGASNMAIVGAANALLRPERFAGFCAAQMLSPVGQCRAFDADGEGFVRAEGAAAFVLKPLETALQDNDPIIGAIVGTGANNDGRTGGLSLPNGDAQAELIDRVFREHGVCPDDVAYVEAHGTGTAAGDPIEAAAIGRMIGQARSENSSLLIGSIKTNIGHLEPAAGLAGLAKALLCLNKRQVPPQLHFETPNPDIDFEGLRIKVVDKLSPLPATEGRTLAAVNSFGFGGANAHVVVAEPPAPPARQLADLKRPWFIVSGRSASAMQAAAARLSQHLAADDQVSLEELSGNLLTRRTWHTYRTAIWADDLVELRRALDAVAADGHSTNAVSGTAAASGRPAFVFTGNGPQWWGMGRGLYEHCDTFRDTLEEVDAIFRDVAGLRLADEMLRSEAESRMAMTEIAQPALFALQLGLVRCLAEDGLFPGAVVGHSAGELAAAHCAGMFDLETIIRIVAARSHEQGKTAGAGAMAAIGLEIDKAEKVLESYDGLVLAGYNAPDALTTAGPIDAIDALVARLEADGAFAKKLRLNYAFHSPAMDPVEAEFRQRVRDVRGREGGIPFYSTVTGTRLGGETMDIDYWWRNVRDPVMFRPAVDAMCADGHTVFVEIGPHPNLLGYTKAIARAAGKTARGVETLRRGDDERVARRKAIAAAAVAGSAFDFSKQFPAPVRAIPLPTYPWQHESYINRPSPRASLAADPTGHAFLGSRIGVAKDVWHQHISLSKLDFLSDHLIRDTILFPAAGFFELAIAAGRASGVDETLELRSVQIEKALPLDAEREVELQTFVDRVDHGVSIRSRVVGSAADVDPEPFVEHVRAVLRNRPRFERWVNIDALRARLTRGSRSRSEHYALAASRGLNYGSDFQTVEHVDVGEGEVVAELVRRNPTGAQFTLDPTQLDGALQVMIGLIEATRDRRLFIPMHLDRLVVHASTKPLDTVYAHVIARGGNRFYLTADIALVAPDGNVVAELFGMEVRSVGAATGANVASVHHVLKPIHAFDRSLPVVEPLSLVGDTPSSPAAAGRQRLAGAYVRHLDDVCAAFTAATFRTLSGDKAFTLGELAADGRVASRHVRYASALLDHAIAAGVVEVTASGELKAISAVEPLALWESYAKLYPQYSSEWFLAARIGLHQAALLRGDQELSALLFGGSSSSPIVEQIYDQGFAFVGANAALADALAAFGRHLPPMQPLRILEIGGGTGGTTAHILNALDWERVHYVFSDVATEFVAGAERRFLNVPSFDTAVFDVANSGAVEALGDPFDVIVAANVLHATPDIRKSVRNVRALLKPKGLFGLIEPARRGYLDFLFGLLAGTWQFEDCSVRFEHPVLPGSDWVTVLREEGFADAAPWDDVVSADGVISHLVLARAADDAEVTSTPTTATVSTNERRHNEAWLIVDTAGENGELDRELAERLRAREDVVSVVHIRFGDAANGAPNGSWVPIDGNDEAAWLKLCKGLRNSQPTRIAFLARRTTAETTPDLAEGWPLVAFAKAANLAEWSSNPRLFIVTENVLADDDVNVAGGCYWAVGRAIVNEQPGWTCHRVDHDGTLAAKHHLLNWLSGVSEASAATEASVDEIRITAQGVFANVIKPVHASGASGLRAEGAQVPFAVTLTAQGSIDNLVAKEVREARRLEPGTVEVTLKAAGLNFKDIILALGMLPPELLRDSAVGPLMGLEGAGVVTRVGAGVTAVAPGDEVMLMAEGTFASSIVVPQYAARKIPAGWSYHEAATLPVVGLTVVHALDTMARLKRGEVLLVHGGAGGIGLVAIQYAKAIGARVIATAGSAEKRDLLRTLGVDCVSDSRTLRFEEDARTFTQGQGVDVVLNSLAGDAMLASLDVLKPFGRFVEIGKRDFEANNRLHLRALEKNISYFAVDLTFLPHQRPELFAETWDRLINACETGAVRPLPFRTYALSGLKDAMRSMQAGRHVGKLVLDLEQADVPPEPLPPEPISFTGGGVHLITGGLGGIGLKLARWIAERGARKIALVGRSGVTSDDQGEAIKAIEALGAEVIVAKADVADGDAMGELVAGLVREHGPISGLMHSVLVLDDHLMTKMTQDQYVRVMRPKVEGAYHLHRLTTDQPMDYFIVFSSLANMFGNPGQANYVAANAYLEQLVLARRAAGLPGLALALAAVSDAGVIQRDETVRAKLNEAIGGAIEFADIPAALDGLLAGGPPIATVINLSGRPTAPIMGTARVAALLGSGSGSGQQNDVGETIDFAAVPPEERAERMVAALVEAVAKVTGAKESRVDAERSLTDLGLDSLMTVEFAAGVERRLGVSIPRPELGRDRNLKDLAAALLERLNLEVTEGAPGDGTGDESLSERDLIERDTTLPDDFIVEQQPGSPRRLDECQGVFLTGASGFLGAFLLDEILRAGAPRVVCLGRGRDDWNARERLVGVLRRAGLFEAAHEVGRRVEVWQGDFAAEDLGLTETRLANLTETIDVIVHSGADVSFIDGYEQMRMANVVSTLRLLEITRRGCPTAFHFVSTLRAYADIDQIRSTQISETVMPAFPPEREGGYVKTKWVADVLAHGARARGLQVGIYRPSFIIGRTTDGYSNVSDLGSALLKYAFDSGTLPDVDVSCPVIPVDVAARRIVAFIDTPGEQFATRHITDWPALSMGEIAKILNANGLSVKLLPVGEFIDRAVAFFRANPGHPALWLPAFFISGASDNPLGDRLQRPILPPAAGCDVDESQAAVALMVRWFRSLAH